MTPESLIQGHACIEWHDYIRPMYENLKVLVTGACGSIGKALMKELKASGSKVYGIDHNEYEVSMEPWCMLGDFTELPQMEDYDVVFHAAAYKHVDLGERNVRAFYTNNELKTKHFLDRILDEAPRAKFVLVSTDKAAGESVMGQSKRACETAILDHQQWALRLVNCAWSRGSVLEHWKDDVAPWSAESNRYFMQLEDAAQALLRIPFLPYGLYTVYDLPMFSMTDLKRSFCKVMRRTPFETRSLRKGDATDEKLCREQEWIDKTIYPHIGKIRLCKDRICPSSVIDG